MRSACIFALFLVALVLPPLLHGASPISPDGTLYAGIADHLFASGRYEDVVRSDEILPTMGHPVLLHLVGGLGVTFLGLSVLAAVLAGMLSSARWWAIIPAFVASLAFSDAFVRYHTVGSISGSIILGTALLCGTVVWFITKPSGWSLGALSLAYAVSLLIRPVLLPVLPLAAIGALIWAYRAGMRRQITTILTGAVLWVGVLVWSVGVSGDSRMVTGTYGAIPLFSAWNPYIDLQRNYNSSLWDTPRGQRGKRHFVNSNGWRERDSRLKRQALEFALSNPVVAVNGYLFRLGRYTISAENPAYIAVLINGYILSLLVAAGWFLFIAGKRSAEGRRGLVTLLPSAVLLGLFGITAALSALFSYAGARYVVGTFCILLLLLAELGRVTGGGDAVEISPADPKEPSR